MRLKETHDTYYKSLLGLIGLYSRIRVKPPIVNISFMGSTHDYGCIDCGYFLHGFHSPIKNVSFMSSTCR